MDSCSSCEVNPFDLNFAISYRNLSDVLHPDNTITACTRIPLLWTEEYGDRPTPDQITSVLSALCETGYGFQSIRRFGGLFFANPSPDGRGCREAAGEGYNNKD